MSYIGNQPSTAAFITDQFNGNGSTTAFTLSAAPATTSSILVAVSGVLQDPTTYSVSGTTLTFSAAPPSGTGNISVRFLGIPASGVVTTAYRTQTEFTATAGQTTFSVPSYTVGYIDVYRNGVKLGTADFTATNGTTVVLASGATAGDLVTTVSFYVSSVLNAIPAVAGAVTDSYILSGAVTPAKLSTGGMYWDTSGNVGIGTTSPSVKLNVTDSSDGGNSGTIRLGSDGTYYAQNQFRYNSSEYRIGVYGPGQFMAFYTAGTERARITSDGIFLVNLNSTAVVTNFMVKATSAGTSVYNSWNSDASGTRYHFEFRDGAGATSRGNITTNGANTTYATSSDYRLKENIAPITNALATVTQLKPSTWTWKENQEEGQGFIAHELAEVIPQAVTGEKDAVDEKGNPKYQGVDASFLVATLTAAIQELNAKVDAQAAEIAALKGTQP